MTLDVKGKEQPVSHRSSYCDRNARFVLPGLHQLIHMRGNTV